MNIEIIYKLFVFDIIAYFSGGLKEVALQCGFVFIVEDCLATSFAYVLDYKTIIVVKGPLPPSREGRGATF
jgi:hypothetical protein